MNNKKLSETKTNECVETLSLSPNEVDVSNLSEEALKEETDFYVDFYIDLYE